ncbi:sulfate adenylyltransferase [candidate division WOR-1 bacterium DG_54_3]|uniref:Sulfate adenylyltransferase n=1 Tax=candidate division WOR-1 bacterium DG_54_3 TaxID=1703775 RepID=A0A0S7XNY5_UNCSA|nr:MAG: sulfate adenylyltransferase [candidate division WOR-1 bacterium DG_54_3]
MLVKPHGGELVDRVLSAEKKAEAQAEIAGMFQMTVSKETVSEIQNIARGVFSPLEGFLNRAELESVVTEGHLASGLAWTIPILLAVEESQAEAITEGQTLALLDETGAPVALLHLEQKYQFDKGKIARGVFGTDDDKHPGVQKLFRLPDLFLAGDVDLLEDIRTPYEQYNLSPRETRYLFRKRGWDTVVAFQTRNPPHRAHEYIQKCALEICDGLFINPVIGKKKSGDFTDDVILKAYQTLIDDFYPPDRVVMSILPWQMRYAGPKEAIFHAIVRKNFGCTHHIIGRDHAGVGDYYDTYAAHRIFADFPDLGIQPLFFEHSFYCQACENMATAKTCPHDKSSWLSPSGTKIRAIITEGVQVAPEITRSEIAKVLASEERPFVE